MDEQDDEITDPGEINRLQQVRIEYAKVCAPGQLQELIDGSQILLQRLQGVNSPVALRRLLPWASQERRSLETQWQQRSGTIRVVVRVRPAANRRLPGDEEASPEAAPAAPAVEALPGTSRLRGLKVSVARGTRAADQHFFKRFDYILGPEKDQDDVFRELSAMLPNTRSGVSGGQSACILAYGQTGSGKTHTMHGGLGTQQGLLPRVLVEVFKLAEESGATIAIGALEIYNDIAYDLLDETQGERGKANEAQTRGFQAGHLPPPQGLNFQKGCANALDQVTSVPVRDVEEANSVLAQAARRRTTRSTVFNATSSRSHSMVFIHGYLGEKGEQEPLLRLAFVDLAGSERLPASENTGPVAEESRHINLSLSALGSVIHALRHRANHLPYRTCLLTRLLEPFFGSNGRVLLCVCVSPEQRFAQETLCSLNFADRASRAVLGAENPSEVQRSHALQTLRGAYGVVRSLLRSILPSSMPAQVTQPLPDPLADRIIMFMADHGEARFVSRSWSKFCERWASRGRHLQHSSQLAKLLLSFLETPIDAASVCRCWWSAAGAYRLTVEAASAHVLRSYSGISKAMWLAVPAQTRVEMWKALLKAGGGSGAIGEKPLSNVRECVIAGSPKPEALKQVLVRCTEVRVVEIAEPNLVSSACAGLVKCSKLRALKCVVDLVPNLVNMRQVLTQCRQLKVLNLTGTSEHHLSLDLLVDEMPKFSALRELSVVRGSAGWKDFERLAKCCPRLQVLRLPFGFVESGDSALSPPPLIPLGRLKGLRTLDFRSLSGPQKHRRRAWLTEDMFGMVSQLKELREVRASDQKLLGDRCFHFLRRHAVRLRTLHLDGCKAMCGDVAFGLLHNCELLQSLRLPSIHIGESGRMLGTGTARWCQGLHCRSLQDLRVDSWVSLDDASVQALVKECRQLRTVWLRQAPRLSDDAVAYLASLLHLSNLALCGAAGLTDRSFSELVQSGKLRVLDLAGCRQLSEMGTCKFASVIGVAGGLPLISLRLDSCPHLGRAAAEALAACPGLKRCSLASCRPIVAAASAWHDLPTRRAALEALGLDPALAQQPSGALPEEEAADEDLAGSAEPEAPREETVQCAICMDDITPEDPVWECPVCCNKLHDIEDCARGWLRCKQSCPTCRAASWAPPEEEGSSGPSLRRNPFRPFQADPSSSSSGGPARRQRSGARAQSAEVTRNGRGGETNGQSTDFPMLSISGQSAAVAAGGRLAQPFSSPVSSPGSSPIDAAFDDFALIRNGRPANVASLEPLGRPAARISSSDLQLDVRGSRSAPSSTASSRNRRPPRPQETASTGAAGAIAVSGTGGRGSADRRWASPVAASVAYPSASPASSPIAPSERSAGGRSRSTPPTQAVAGGRSFGLAGLAIVGNLRPS